MKNKLVFLELRFSQATILLIQRIARSLSKIPLYPMIPQALFFFTRSSDCGKQMQREEGGAFPSYFSAPGHVQDKTRCTYVWLCKKRLYSQPSLAKCCWSHWVWPAHGDTRGGVLPLQNCSAIQQAWLNAQERPQAGIRRGFKGSRAKSEWDTRPRQVGRGMCPAPH